MKVRYRRYFVEGEHEVESVQEAIDFIDSDAHYATSVILDSGEEIAVDPWPLALSGGGPSKLIEILKARLL